MPVISTANQKGGCGKTTTAVNLGAALQRLGKKVLLIDADPQANLSQSLGMQEEPEHNLYTEIKKEMSGNGGDLRRAIVTLESGLSAVPASIDLAIAESELVSVYGREQIFSTMIEPLLHDYDFIFIDCPHAIGMLTVNALTASDYVLIPLPGEFLPLKGVYSFMHQYDKIKKKLNRKLELLGLVLTKYDERKTMNVQVHDELVREFGDKVCQTVIRTNIQLAKAQELGKDIFSFDKQSNGAKDYEQLADELLKKIPRQSLILN
ncbi:MAG TPA: ParA family protein [Chitinophagaceae bacterium]|nr:ParA family protein [Chitinophagaceae bacterium]